MKCEFVVQWDESMVGDVGHHRLNSEDGLYVWQQKGDL